MVHGGLLEDWYDLEGAGALVKASVPDPFEPLPPLKLGLANS